MATNDRLIDTTPLDVRAQPLIDALIDEYATRYDAYRPDSRASARDELARYPAELFAPPEGAFVLLLRDGATIGGGALGRTLVLLPIAWADWPLGLTSGKYDAMISNVGVTEKRKEKYDFTTYRLGLHGFYVRTASPIAKIAEPKDIAGLRIITGAGTSQERILLEWSRRNVAQGLKATDLLYFDDDAASRIALLSGRADAELNPNAALAYETARDGKIRRVGVVNAGWPANADVAIATRRGSGLAPALTLATNALIGNGRYGQALARWGLQSEAVARAETNPPGLPSF